MIDIKKIKKKISYLKLKNKKIVLCHGVFDLIHLGHINHFREAKKYGDFLIVSITDDKFIKKGPGRPLFNKLQRAEFLKGIKIVDEVVVSNQESAVDMIKIIKPNFYVKGPDYKDNTKDKTKKIYLEKLLVKKYGGVIKYTSGETYSSSNLINSTNFALNDVQKKFIDKLKKKYNFDEIVKIFNKFKSLKVLIIGELIIDQYFFGSVIGKSGKEPHLVLSEKFNEKYLGGSAAIANHLSTFCKQISLISPFGFEKEYSSLIKKKLDKKVKTVFFKPTKLYNTIIKKRFVDQISNYKLFGSYILPNNNENQNKTKISTFINNYNQKNSLIIVSDYGHHFIDNKLAKKIISNKNFLALTTQVNAANIGYHSLDKYYNADLLVVNENELRQELRDTTTDVKILLRKIIINKKIKNIIVTRGKHGAMLMNKNFKSFECPAFASRTIDKVGAGDTMLSITSLAVKLKLDPELALLLGSIGAAKSVETIGNKESLSFDGLERTIEYLWK
tara:strand:- start:2980 stop:4488 length:1509 start_codon:yes stop_codon:yes gene_type:complete